MLSRPPRSRSELIQIIERHAPSSVIGRACLSGSAEVLGGFRQIGERGLAGWIVTLTSVNHQVYHVAVLCNEVTHRLEVVRIKTVPWEHWAGWDRAGLYLGDHPMRYMEKADEALQRR